MPDHARSDNPAVQIQLDRFATLSPGRDVLGLDRIAALLARLGNPHLAMPPVFHVAGTNGKGSTCAFLRAAVEAAGLSAHVYTSPHLCRFNERIRVAGSLIDDDVLAPLLSEVLDQATNIDASFFEITTAAAFLAFSRSIADVAIIEVGLGGRLDATNVISTPAVCGIAQLGIDHQMFLGHTAVEIAGEKAGIAKHGVPLVTMAYDGERTARIAAIAASVDAPVIAHGTQWHAAAADDGAFDYRDAAGALCLPSPRLRGAHQIMNAALAVAMIRHQHLVTVPDAALRAAMGSAKWPGRMQKLSTGPISRANREIWVDGCHNEACAKGVAAFFAQTLPRGRPLHIITGILQSKDARGMLSHFARVATHLTAVTINDHICHPPDDLEKIATELGLVANVAPSIEAALDTSGERTVLIVGSLYLAGEVLRANDELPD